MTPLFLIFTALASAADLQVTFPDSCGTAVLSFDDRKIAAARVEKLKVFHPRSGDVLRFRSNRDVTRRRALITAQRALEKEVPVELKTSYARGLILMQGWLDMDEAISRYEKTGNIQELEKSVGKVEPKSTCTHEVSGLQHTDKKDRVGMARLRWSSCVNAELYRMAGPDIHQAAWARFLAAYKITEERENDEECPLQGALTPQVAPAQKGGPAPKLPALPDEL